MKILLKIGCFLVVLSIITLNADTSYAFNPFKVDFSKTGGKFAAWVQKQYSNLQEGLANIGKEQEGEAIGEGGKPTKKAIGFLKEKYAELMEAYNDGKKKLQDSLAYEIAGLSKEVAELTLKLTQITVQMDEELKAVEEEMNIRLQALEAKLNVAHQNLDTTTKIYEEELAALEEGSPEYQAKLSSFAAATATLQAAIDAITQDIAQTSAELNQKRQSIELKYAAQAKALEDKIMSLKAQIEELVEKRRQGKKDEQQDPEEGVDEAAENFSLQEGEVATLTTRKEKEDKRQSLISDATIKIMEFAANTAREIEDTKISAELVTDIHELESGRSEVLQGSIIQTADQLSSIYNYLLIELMDIEKKAAVMLSQNKEYKVGETSAVIDICKYGPLEEDSSPLGELLGSIDALKTNISDISSAVGETADTINNSIQETVDTVQGVQEGITAGFEGM